LTMITMGCGPKPPTQAGGHPASHWGQEMKGSGGKARRPAPAKLGNVGTTDPGARPAPRGRVADAGAAPPAQRGQGATAYSTSGEGSRSAVTGYAKERPQPASPRLRRKGTRAHPLGQAMIGGTSLRCSLTVTVKAIPCQATSSWRRRGRRRGGRRVA